ncbi:YaiI/YqxD family protein [Shewanella sp. WXL01]|uniref:UPF0178 protein EXU30_01165 n=1 Tax=Shewanella maritima TaxID=2520507 RepID=A0A411PD27_9GAMM|nr:MULTISPECIES: YaiI/YqxD family protein [Shewanella]NKF50544.1 YaiI/YqxD family protein [Shewanella sp. WXL01]QBF81456.1 YaiI/YqxD family protein [Shewanella maritima]
MSKPFIWVDADACPNPVKDMLFRAAERKQLQLRLVANQLIGHPPSQFIKAIRVSSGFDEADNFIVEQASQGDLIVTADIPLAADGVAKGALVVNPRGTLYTKDNVKQALNSRNFMEEMRSAGVVTQGPAKFSAADKHAFAKVLDKWLAKIN